MHVNLYSGNSCSSLRARVSTPLRAVAVAGKLQKIAKHQVRSEQQRSNNSKSYARQPATTLTTTWNPPQRACVVFVVGGLGVVGMKKHSTSGAHTLFGSHLCYLLMSRHPCVTIIARFARAQKESMARAERRDSSMTSRSNSLIFAD